MYCRKVFEDGSFKKSGQIKEETKHRRHISAYRIKTSKATK